MRHTTVAALVALVGCRDAPPPAERVNTPEVLRAVPTTLRVSGVTLSLEVEAWRSFQPTVGEVGDPLIAILRLRAADEGVIPGALTVEQVYLLRGAQLVVGTAREEQPRLANAREVEFVLRDGPRWATGDSIDVVVSLAGLAAPATLVRAPAVAIARVD